MKKVMMAAAALAVLGAAASSALAQDGSGRRDRGGDGQGARQDGGSGYNPAVRRSWRNTPENVQAPAAQAPQAQAPQPPQAPAVGDGRRGGGGDGRDRDRRDWDGRDGRYGDGRRDWNDRDRNWDGRRGWNDRRAADRPRYDRRAYPWVHRTERRYHGPRYRAPSGFYARSWSYGQVLPRGWYGSDYRLNDWWSYGLPIPPAGYEWVRVGDDVLLVDIFNGRVVQVVYDLFW